MAVHFTCNDPQALLATFTARIEQADPKGKITTWQLSNDGSFYTHRAAEVNRKAWFRPVVDLPLKQLTFLIVKPQNADISRFIYAYYHGHLIETFLTHFDRMFSAANVSAAPQPGERVQ
ncbi:MULTISPECIES: hypothetical protein [Burkholderia]|uniref:hypothetical protein n=1 Tax=Burkholderia TaxID=32008 RepID=UPI0007541C85|nr:MULTISPECIES: hypothetical protein [Burkholderia]KVV10224.1 hypothetical protein WK77_12350 [Burkholderia ubonensis]KVZ42995.1 hypothetical protein WL16_26885 [Burkholderia ubonensis]VBP13371.1 Uncharacterised protein [Burkholderia pseudomallei]